MLRLEDVTIGFGGPNPVVSDIYFEVEAGERLLLCGAASSGKTTLMQAACGLIPRLIAVPHFAGTVSLDGVPIATLSKDALFTRIGIVAQNVEDQLWDLEVEDLIAFPLENRGVAKAEIRARLTSLLDEMELWPLAGRRVLTLSGGERRMVAIAAALAPHPSLLVLDEPTTGLDPSARSRLAGALGRRGREIGAMLVAEQDAVSLSAVIDRVALLRAGRLTPAEPTSAALADDICWLEAGIVPPRRGLRKRFAATIGRSLLAVSGLRTRLKRADGRPVLDDVGFEVRAGEVVALIGRNGAGKTTLFQSILGLSPISAGTIAIDGQAAGDWTAARRARKVAYLPQNMRRVLFNMSAREEVVFALTASTAASRDPDILARALAMLEKYGLGPLAETNPFALSARQQALLGLACADAAGADVAILDEPLLARDLEGRRMLDLFLETMARAGRGVMLISHDLDLVDDVASRILVLAEGRIAFDGAVEAGWSSPAFRALGWPAPAVEGSYADGGPGLGAAEREGA
ncbi:ATP-binding cassette domain-containing protein [Rhizobiales bacterium Sp-1]|uniref:ATP-binding cassette domain-containing protein n=1 Tax=Segnochrobactrum spirostomi TaxID=2608987 RepID=A0A6A7YBH0_9HYPH|nr:ATP-binding cassette domain-containing protein [Segnochrobactrum spirostomi]